MREEKNGVEVVENFEDDFNDIKEMQKTQELKKISLEDEKKEEVKEKKNHPMFVSILIILLLCAFTCMGFFGGIYYYKNSIEKEKISAISNNSKHEKENENEKTDDLEKTKNIVK